MQFSSGQTVIHPHHGPATVTETFTRTVGGRPTDFVALEVHRTNLRVAVPVQKADEIGLRAVYAETETQELLEVLRGESEPHEEVWSRRVKANHDKLRLGDLLVTAAVVRDLIRRDEDNGLSPGEKEMLREARGKVASELALSLSLPDEEADALIESTVHEADSPADT